MREIDEAREYLGKMRTEWYGVGPIASAILSAEERVERLLRKWWDQGCREVEVSTDGRPTEAQWREMLASVRADAWRAGTREREARDAMQSAIDRAREACSGNISPGNDWIDELIGLLRVTRGQRDDAEERWQKEVARANERDKAAAEAQKIARANKVRLEDSIERAERAEAEVETLRVDLNKLKIAADTKVAECNRLAGVADALRRDYAVAAKQIEGDRAEISKLTLSANELNATNKKIHADRDRMAEAIRAALAAPVSRSCLRTSGIDLLDKALKDYESVTPSVAAPAPPQIATQEWVYEEVDRVRGEIDAVVNRAIKLAIEKHAESAPHGSSKPIFYK